MRGQVTIGDKTVDMLANGATPFIYKRIFKRDFLTIASDAKNIDTNALAELGFVMYMQTVKPFKQILDETTIDEFYTWVSDFEPLDIPMAAGQIFALFHSQESMNVTAKKKHARRSAEQAQL